MKKLTLILGALVIAGASFACDGKKEKACCKKDEKAKMSCCSKKSAKECKEMTKKDDKAAAPVATPTAAPAPKKA
jgi:hypothetical protein